VARAEQQVGDDWPPAVAPPYVRSDEFGRMIEQMALQLQQRYPHLEMLGAVGLVWDWFERKAEEQPDFFSSGRFPRPAALRAYVRQALWRAAANELRKERAHQFQPIPTSVNLAAADAGGTFELDELLDALPPPMGHIVRGIVLEQRGMEDVGSTLNLSRWQIKRQLEKACELLGNHFDAQE